MAHGAETTTTSGASRGVAAGVGLTGELRPGWTPKVHIIFQFEMFRVRLCADTWATEPPSNRATILWWPPKRWQLLLCSTPNELWPKSCDCFYLPACLRPCVCVCVRRAVKQIFNCCTFSGTRLLLLKVCQRHFLTNNLCAAICSTITPRSLSPSLSVSLSPLWLSRGHFDVLVMMLTFGIVDFKAAARDVCGQFEWLFNNNNNHSCNNN